MRKIFYQFILLVKYYRLKYVYHQKINLRIKKKRCTPITNKYKKDIYSEFGKYGFNKITTKWHEFFSDIYGVEEVKFIPEILFYSRIEPALNNSIMFPALEDKNLLDSFFMKSILPNAIVKNINGFFYLDNVQISMEESIEACLNYDSIVIKPSIGTSGGTGVKKIDLVGDKVLQLKNLFKDYNSNFIVQEILGQHPELIKLNKSSLNTLRIITYMRKDEVIPLSAGLRIGKSGSFTDNTAGGGMACGIESNGALKSVGLDTYGNKYTSTDSGILLKGFQIPKYDLIIKKVKELHMKLPHFRIVSWDVAINEKSNIIIVEYNAMGQDINLHQMLNGPLFGNYFEEILKETQNYDPLKRSLVYGG